MNTNVVILERHLSALRAAVLDAPGVEGAAFLLCGESRTNQAAKLLVKEVIRLEPADYLIREPLRLSLRSEAYVRVAKRARQEGLSILFAHSHPDGFPHFSSQDDKEELKLLPFLSARVPQRIHGTLVVTSDGIAGRMYVPERQPVDRITVMGGRWDFLPQTGTQSFNPTYFDRQIRAFGEELQPMLSGLHIGIVGLGGTGSAVAEQLARLGIGTLSLFDGDKFEASNVNRVYGSSSRDVGTSKVAIAARNIDHISAGTTVIEFPRHITHEPTARALRNCDIVFGCTDKQTPRAILVQLALRYLIPVIDTGVLIDSRGGRITGVHGRVTTLVPDEACLFCRGRLSANVIRAESLSPDERRRLVQEGYAPELPDRAPAVVPFTTATAALGVTELLHRLTGFMGQERQSTEVLVSFDQSRIRTNKVPPEPTCSCADCVAWGRGDSEPFLDLFWQG